MSASIGVDLGTTFSAVAYVDPKTQLPKIIPNREGRNLTPSVIQFLNGEEIFGGEAEDAFNAGEENCVATFKREMGEEKPFCHIDGKPYTSEELSAKLLRRLKEDAEAALGEPIKDAVVTVPAYFYSKQREATLRAAQVAGLKVKKLIDEPNAAAMTYGLSHWRENANILVYDLGGGTFDVTLVHMGKDGELATIATRGNHTLGGRDWDARLQEILIERFEEETGLDLREDREARFTLGGMAEEVKKELSAPNMESVKVVAKFHDYGKATTSVTRAEFEERTVDLLSRTGALCLAVLEEAGLAKEDVADVLLVGGSTRMPQVRSYLEKLFGKPPLSRVNPDEAVALGAAIQASKENESYVSLSVAVVDGKKTTDRTGIQLTSASKAVKAEKNLGSVGLLSLRETTAHAMGVVAIDKDNDRYYNEIVIPANHPRPVRAAKKFRFFPSSNGDNELAIYVLQGDDENPLNCQITSKYVASGIRNAKENAALGVVIRVQYSYDENGIVRVQARQDYSNVDLPIRKENLPSDLSAFGRPVSANQNAKGGKGSIAIQGVGGQGFAHKFKAVTFSNVLWQKYDDVASHPIDERFDEPPVHVVAEEKRIEFHGYHVSEMAEGVQYEIEPDDSFVIECDVDTSTIQPHPGGSLNISLGLIEAELTEDGGEILLGGKRVAKVGPQFHLRMSLTEGGRYEVAVDGKVVGEKHKESKKNVVVRFGFVHESHCCHKLSHAYVSDISMSHAAASEEDESSDAETWDD